MQSLVQKLKFVSENEWITKKRYQHLWTEAISGPLLEIGITKIWCFRKFCQISFSFLIKKADIYNLFVQKAKDLWLFFFNYLLLRLSTLTFLKILLNQWRLAYQNWKLHLKMASRETIPWSHECSPLLSIFCM